MPAPPPACQCYNPSPLAPAPAPPPLLAAARTSSCPPPSASLLAATSGFSASGSPMPPMPPAALIEAEVGCAGSPSSAGSKGGGSAGCACVCLYVGSYQSRHQHASVATSACGAREVRALQVRHTALWGLTHTRLAPPASPRAPEPPLTVPIAELPFEQVVHAVLLHLHVLLRVVGKGANWGVDVDLWVTWGGSKALPEHSHAHPVGTRAVHSKHKGGLGRMRPTIKRAGTQHPALQSPSRAARHPLQRPPGCAHYARS